METTVCHWLNNGWLVELGRRLRGQGCDLIISPVLEFDQPSLFQLMLRRTTQEPVSMNPGLLLGQPKKEKERREEIKNEKVEGLYTNAELRRIQTSMARSARRKRRSDATTSQMCGGRWWRVKKPTNTPEEPTNTPEEDSEGQQEQAVQEGPCSQFNSQRSLQLGPTEEDEDQHGQEQ